MEKRVILTCVANNRLSSLINETVTSKNNNNFEIKTQEREHLFNSEETSFVIVDDDIYSEIMKKQITFENIILIRTSNKDITNYPHGSEIITINTPFRLRDLFQIISNRLELITSRNERIKKFKKFTYDPRTRSLFNKSFSLRFTEKESNIFEYLLLNCNKYISKKELLEKIWSYSDNIDTHTLETHIYSLRKKIEKNLTLKNLIIFEEKKGYFLDKGVL